MNRLRLSIITGTLLATAGCSGGNLTPTAPEAPSYNGAVLRDSTEEGGGWAGSGHDNVMSADTLSRDGGWAGSGH